MKTLAAVLTQINHPLELLELEIPPLLPGQVLVEMAFSGLCHSQLNEWKGLKGHDPYLPHTLGHEGSGRVLEVGPHVQKVRPGDSVVLSWIKGEGAEVPGTSYLYNGRKIQSGAISTFLTKAVISENRVFPIPSHFSLREAALLGCAIPTGAGVVLKEMNLQEGQSFVVFGVGGIGSSALLAAHQKNAYPILAVDLHEEKLAWAKTLGATHTLNSQTPHLLEEILSLFGGKGADFALEAAGRKEVMELAFQSVRPGGGICILAGNLPQGQTIAINPFDLIRGKKIFGTWGGGSQVDRDLPSYLSLFMTPSSPLKRLIHEEVPLENINLLMNRLEGGLLGRGMISFPYGVNQ